MGQVPPPHLGDVFVHARSEALLVILRRRVGAGCSGTFESKANFETRFSLHRRKRVETMRFQGVKNWSPLCPYVTTLPPIE